MTDDHVDRAREAIARCDWDAALVAATGGEVDEPAREAERLDLVAEAAWWLGRLDACVDARENAFRIFDDLGDEERAGQCAVWLYQDEMLRGHPSIAGAWLRRARRALEPHPECEPYGHLLLREAESAHGGGDLAAAATRAEAAVELGRRLRSPNLEAESLQTLGRVVIDQGDVREGLALLDEAMLLALDGRLGAYSTGKVYCSLISACEELGDLERAAEWTEATARWSEKHPFAIWPGICRVHHAVVLKRQGSLAEAAVAAVRAGEELLHSHVGNAAAAFAEVGDIRRRLGDLDAAEEAFARATDLSGEVCGGFALLRLAQGRIADARAAIDTCMSSCGSSPLARAKLLPVLVHVAAAAGDLGAADAAAIELARIAETYGSPFLLATARATRGRLQLAAGDDDALDTLRRVLRDWQDLDVPYEVATTQTLIGEALRRAGDDAAATQAFASAAELFERIGAQLDARLALDDGARRLLPAGLTEREAEVLELVASGMSNSEIAAALCLSIKTVSRHLSNIFTKIDVSSRAAATAFAFQHGVVDR